MKISKIVHFTGWLKSFHAGEKMVAGTPNKKVSK